MVHTILQKLSADDTSRQGIDSFHIVSAHASNSLVPRYLREITREGATVIWLPYITLWNMETIERKINSQVKFRQIVKLNDINVSKISD